jgi:hypothetical protein
VCVTEQVGARALELKVRHNYLWLLPIPQKKRWSGTQRYEGFHLLLLEMVLIVSPHQKKTNGCPFESGFHSKEDGHVVYVIVYKRPKLLQFEWLFEC